MISQLDIWPVCTPVNASPVPSREPAHDSGPVWLAGPSPYGSFIHYSLPAFTGAFHPFTYSFALFFFCLPCSLSEINSDYLPTKKVPAGLLIFSEPGPR